MAWLARVAGAGECDLLVARRLPSRTHESQCLQRFQRAARKYLHVDGADLDDRLADGVEPDDRPAMNAFDNAAADDLRNKLSPVVPHVECDVSCLKGWVEGRRTSHST